MSNRPSHLFAQSGVIPYRRRNGVLEVLLITSSDGQRWGIPKGVVERAMTPANSAAKEAYEEAGIKGRVHPDSIGRYHYQKWGGTCQVEVFLMEVTEEHDQWPEQRQRQRVWASVEEAVRRVAILQLRELINGIGRFLA